MIRAVLHPGNLGALQRLGETPLLLGFGFDGTLVPPTIGPAEARLADGTYERLVRVAVHYPTVVISSRTTADLVPRLKGIPLVAVVGSQGLEPEGHVPVRERVVDEWHEQLARMVCSEPGVAIEHRGASLEVAWRRSRARLRARRAVLKAIAGLRPVPRAMRAPDAVRLFPDSRVNKGTAFLALLRSLGCAGGLYIGDDQADEDVFKLGPSHGIVGVRIGRDRYSHATYRLGHQRHVDLLLDLLVNVRSGRWQRPTITRIFHD